MAVRICLTDPRRVKERHITFDNWVEVWSYYEKLVVKYLVFNAMRHLLITIYLLQSATKSLTGIVLLCMISNTGLNYSARMIVDRLQFDKVDMNLSPTILDSTAICPKAAS